ncbi:FAD-binding oxidoreductase [Candidatus Saccharibacteria bacterium]|nr:FAD-binding oxidoreductase [Candidatus Saccharibacteria bacterium]
MNKIAKYLNQHLVGNAYADDAVLERFSTDKSILKIKPQVVVVPRVTDDVRKLVRFAHQMTEKGIKVGVTPRGNGNDKTGAAIGEGVVVAVGDGMKKFLEIDVRKRLVRVQPGLTIGELNGALALYGMKVPVEPGYSGHTIGGMIANGLVGERSAQGGRIDEYVEQVEVVLASGEVIQTERLSRRELNRKKGLQSLEGEIYRELDNLLEDKADAIRDLINEDSLDNAGYEAIKIVKAKDGSFDLTPMFFASQGTLGVVVEVILRAEFASDEAEYVLAEFENLDVARDVIDAAIKLEPSVLDMYDAAVVKEVRKYGKVVDVGEGEFTSKVSLLIGFGGQGKSKRKLRRMEKFLAKLEGVRFVTTDDVEEEKLIKMRDVVNLYLNSSTKGVRVPVFDGASVPTGFLGEYINQVAALGKKFGVEMSVYGSVLNEIYNVRPGFDLGSLSDRQSIFKIMTEYAAVVSACEGTLTGSGAEGRVKSLTVQKGMNEQLVEINEKVKEIFDPKGILNPGVKVGVEVKDLVSALRKDYREGIIRE